MRKRTQGPQNGNAVEQPARLVRNDVAELPEELRQLVDQMLTEGATFEDVVEAVNDRGGDSITLAAVQNYFRGSLEIQARRVRRQVETAQALKQALGDPDSANRQLAEAALLTGFLRLNRKGADLNIKDAVRARLERENLHLKQQLLRLRVRRELQDQKFAKSRLRTELARWELTKAHIAKLKQSLEKEGDRTQLGPETLQKIYEIYGLISQPIGATEGRNG